MRKIYRYSEYFGYGELSGLFTAEEGDVAEAMGGTVYLGEALGKHSDVDVVISEVYLTVLSEDHDFVNKFEEILGQGTISGTNPVQEYIDQLEDEEEDED